MHEALDLIPNTVPPVYFLFDVHILGESSVFVCLFVFLNETGGNIL
jgi:hypothetical protein